MTVTINAVSGTGVVTTSDGSGIVKLQSNSVTTNALAWVNFNGVSGSVAIRASYNVSSITRTATGDYTINFTSALSDANFATTCGGYGGNPCTVASQTTTTCRVLSFYSGVYVDVAQVTVAVFGN